jgi:hypothetical protein
MEPRLQGDGVVQPLATLNLFATLSWKPLPILGVLKIAEAKASLRRRKRLLLCIFAVHFVICIVVRKTCKRNDFVACMDEARYADMLLSLK